MHKTTYAPVIYTSLCVMFWAPNGTRLSARSHFTGPKKLGNSRAQPPPTSPRNVYASIKTLCTGLNKSQVHEYVVIMACTRTLSLFGKLTRQIMISFITGNLSLFGSLTRHKMMSYQEVSACLVHRLDRKL